LIELLISVAVLGIIITSIAGAIMSSLELTDATETTLSESRDAQITTAYLASDAQSSDSVTLSDTSCSGAGVTPVVTFDWIDAGTLKTAQYVVSPPTGDRHLVRHYCEGGTHINSIGVAQQLGLADPTVACTPACPGSSTPSTLSLTVIDRGGYSYTLTAKRRAT
jgi:type II secretory pathway pseudopilin PulG